MNKIIVSAFMLTSLITLLIPAVPRVSSTETTTVNVSPKHIDSSVEESFTINMSITNVTNLNAWGLCLLFKPAMLNCAGIWVPSKNIFAPHGIEMFAATIDSTTGSVSAFCALNGTFGVNGSGTLCQIEFDCKAPGITILDIANEMQAPGTYLQGPPPDYNFISFEATDGLVKVDASGFKENIFEATQNSEIYPVVIFSNSTVGPFDYDEALKTMTFDVSGPDYTVGLSFVFFSKELLNGTFAVLVNDEAIYYTLSENKTHNILSFTYAHSLKDIKILLTLTGDVNGDREVDMLDISIIIDAFLTSPGDPEWNPLADINRDNEVDMLDISIATDNFLKTWSP